MKDICSSDIPTVAVGCSVNYNRGVKKVVVIPNSLIPKQRGDESYYAHQERVQMRIKELIEKEGYSKKEDVLYMTEDQFKESLRFV